MPNNCADYYPNYLQHGFISARTFYDYYPRFCIEMSAKSGVEATSNPGSKKRIRADQPSTDELEKNVKRMHEDSDDRAIETARALAAKEIATKKAAAEKSLQFATQHSQVCPSAQALLDAVLAADDIEDPDAPPPVPVASAAAAQVAVVVPADATNAEAEAEHRHENASPKQQDEDSAAHTHDDQSASGKDKTEAEHETDKIILTAEELKKRDAEKEAEKERKKKEQNKLRNERARLKKLEQKKKEEEERKLKEAKDAKVKDALDVLSQAGVAVPGVDSKSSIPKAGKRRRRLTRNQSCACSGFRVVIFDVSGEPVDVDSDPAYCSVCAHELFF